MKDGSRCVTDGFECSHLPFTRRDIINHETTLRLASVFVVEQVSVRNLRDTFIGSVLSLEVHVGGPVIGELVLHQHVKYHSNFVCIRTSSEYPHVVQVDSFAISVDCIVVLKEFPPTT